MADKLTQQITDALTRVAAEPGGLPLYASKSEPGLFPNTAAAKPAAQKCLADELVRASGTDTKGKTPRDLYALTEKGWEFLLAAVNPKQVLEDFVRVLEARQGEVGELLDTARRMADSLQGLKEAVTRVLPGVTAARVQNPTPPGGEGEKNIRNSVTSPPRADGLSPPLLSPRAAETATASEARHAGQQRAAEIAQAGEARHAGATAEGVGGWGSSALLTEVSLAPAIVAHLTARAAATDCPLPELFRELARNTALTIGEFHDCLRQMCADGTITLPAWTGPLYALPEPQYALLIGHGIAYYASLRH